MFVMARTPATNPWLLCPRPNPKAALRLFCFPYAGGAAGIFHRWGEYLPPSVELYAVQLPGRGSRLLEVPFKRVPLLIEAAGKELLPYLDKPCSFFGHSMGATIGFELARFLSKEHNIKPAHLFVSGRRAPHMIDTEPMTYHLEQPQFLDELRRLNGTRKDVLDHPELMQLLLPALRADFEMIQTYVYTPGPPLDCSITAFGGLEDKNVKREHIEVWRQHTTARFSLQMFSGDHFFIHEAQTSLLETILRELQRLTSTFSDR
jgi:medium-chain acyl-[acyl-carrier-protein] hydrolase